jgi:hypothetical protein
MYSGMATLARLVLSIAAALALVGHPANRVPSGVREIDVRAPSGLVRVTDPAKVARIVHWFDRLPIAPRGRIFCPLLVRGPVITLAFRDNRSGVLARARYDANAPNHSLVSTRCVPIAFSVHGLPRKLLVGGRFLPRVERLLGVPLL